MSLENSKHRYEAEINSLRKVSGNKYYGTYWETGYAILNMSLIESLPNYQYNEIMKRFAMLPDVPKSHRKK